MLRILDQRGLTLVELLLSVAILALLCAMAVPRVHAAFAASRDAQAERDLTAIAEALDRYYLERDSYPTRLTELVQSGHLHSGVNLRSPKSTYWYFYAVDDNTAPGRAKAYVLGAPGKAAIGEHQLYPGRPLPRGRNPAWVTRAWLHYTPGRGLTLFHDDETPITNADSLPRTLTAYRITCRSSSPTPCDLRTN